MTYRATFRWWQNGQIKGYQLLSGTIVVTEGEERKTLQHRHVSSHKHRAHLEWQAER
ncbi:MAG: hypothetical protein ACJ8CB_27465 [Ktedonobacteraceae bacterium]